MKRARRAKPQDARSPRPCDHERPARNSSAPSLAHQALGRAISGGAAVDDGILMVSLPRSSSVHALCRYFAVTTNRAFAGIPDRSLAFGTRSQVWIVLEHAHNIVRAWTPRWYAGHIVIKLRLKLIRERACGLMQSAIALAPAEQASTQIPEFCTIHRVRDELRALYARVKLWLGCWRLPRRPTVAPVHSSAVAIWPGYMPPSPVVVRRRSQTPSGIG